MKQIIIVIIQYAVILAIFQRRFSKQILIHDIQFYSVGPEIRTIFTSGSRHREVWEPLSYMKDQLAVTVCFAHLMDL